MKRSMTSRRPMPTPDRDPPASPARSGATLLEVLLALALLVLMAGIVVPPLTDRLADRAFTSAADVTLQQFLLARAHAQATGQPIEIVYRDGMVEARRFVPGDRTDPHDVFSDDAAADDAVIAEGWATRALPAGMRLTAAGDAGDAPLRLAVYLPDGSSLLDGRARLLDDDGRVGVFAVNPVSGLPLFERSDPSDPATDPNEDMDDLGSLNPSPDDATRGRPAGDGSGR